MKRLVIIESPYAGDVERNLRYLDAAMLDAFGRGEVPFASHHTFPRVLDDADPEQRRQGIEAGFAIAEAFQEAEESAPMRFDFKRVFYVDLGWSDGMREGRADAERLGQETETRTIEGWSK